MDAVMEKSPLDTPELRRRTGLQASDRTREFERAMTELQRKLWVVKTEEIYEPSFYYRWDLLENWLPEQVKKGEAVSRGEALVQVVRAHLRHGIASQERMMARLFDVSLPEVERALGVLAGGGLITQGVPIRGLPGPWVLWSGGSVTPRKPGGELEKRGKSAYP
jgi:hypothetical protein